MNWDAAVEAMKAGHAVRQASLQKRWLVGHFDGVPVYETGTEAMRLAAAWTGDNKPVTVFQGAESMVLLIPDDRHTEATDWEIDR